MLNITKCVARSFDLDHIDLFWEIADFGSAQDTISAYNFYVLRSEGAEGPYDILAGPFKDQYSFRDFSPNLIHKWRQLHYKVRVVQEGTDTEEITDPVSIGAEPDLVALEIQRQEDVLLRQFTGRRCWIFPKRTFGPKCFCFDRVMGRSTTSNCPSCYDSGYLGGFLTPIERHIQFDPDGDSPSPTAVHGETQPHSTTARLGAYPPVKPKDIIVEAENKRWRVVTMTPTERLRAVVHQELALISVNRGDIEYKLPINLQDLANQEFSEIRNFTNPQHIDDDGIIPVEPQAPDEPMQSNREQSFQYTVLSESDSFTITIPITMVDVTYAVSAQISTIPAGGALALLVARNTGRTRTQFILDASGNLSVGTIIDIIVRDRE